MSGKAPATQAPVPKSGVKGVVWVKASRKWKGYVYDATDRFPGDSRGKQQVTEMFDNLDECVAAQEALKIEIHAKKARMLHDLAQKLPHTRDLPPCPANARDAQPGVVYYGEARFKANDAFELGFRPERYRREGAGENRFQFKVCCHHGVGSTNACTQGATRSTKGAPAIYCIKHGGTCPHGKQLKFCNECTPNLDGKKASKCSMCRDKLLGIDRRLSKGGCGMCVPCEAMVNAERAAEEAAKMGKPPPAAAKKQKILKKHEIEMLQRLVLSGYVESFTKGMTPNPGEFTREHFFDYRCALAADFKYGEKQMAYVDFVVHPKQGGKLVFIEIDEDEHNHFKYSTLCDSTRMWNVVESIGLNFSGDVSVLWLRVNPDAPFSIGDAVHKLSNTERCNAVCALLDAIAGKETDPPMQVAYAFYQMRADCRAKVLDDPDYHPLVKDGTLTLTHTIGPSGVVLSL